MTALVRLAGRAASWSRVGKAAAAATAPSPLGLFAQRRRAFQGVRMETSGSKGGRGALVVLEGLDRSGKSSQCARLLSFLKGKGYDAEGWRFPDRATSVGQMISAYLANESQLDDKTIHLLFSANRWEKRALMESKLVSGTTLIVDRYSYSGVAFSAAKGLDIEWCKAPENGLIAPDLVIYLDVQPEKAAERGGYGGERYEKIEFQKKVAEHYHSLRDSTWKAVDGSLPMETVEEKLRDLATSCIQECQGNPLTNLAW
ncbi:thymidylate kinase-like [Miscanthus floridulus]|uniref:thymidylate kinase-like n=1 Tax=Miscanthus floridulus TaxID=154761 RepID=UPI003459A5ED